MIRNILTADKNKLVLPIPDDYIGKQVEVIAFTLDEGGKEQLSRQATTFNAVSLDTTNVTFNRDEANER